MDKAKEKSEKRKVRHKRIRARISGTKECPRLCVYRSNNFIYAQLIDDEKGLTLASANSKTLQSKSKSKLEKAKEVGQEVAKQATSKKITKVVFDRGGFIFTGKVKALAEGAREGGLKF